LPSKDDKPFWFMNSFGFISLFGWAPIKEEVLFRVLPLSFVIAFVSIAPRVVFGIMTTFAILFGMIHPYSARGDVQVAIAGFFFGLVFLKCGGMSKAFIKASVCAIAAHGLSILFTVLDAWWQYFKLTR
jgi:Type II CAAX prenyl endopeptidase Rce1-like